MDPMVLDQGIFLEDIDTLIPWGASANNLRKIARPRVDVQRSSIRLNWMKHKILGGIQVGIEAMLSEDPMLRSKTVNDHGLKLVSLGFYNPEMLDPRQEHQDLKARLSAQLGKPTYDGTGSEPDSGLPFTEWDLAEVLVVLMVFERFGEYCVGEIWRKPLPAWRVPRTNRTGV